MRENSRKTRVIQTGIQSTQAGLVWWHSLLSRHSRKRQTDLSEFQASLVSIGQPFSTFLMLPFNAVPYTVMMPDHKIIFVTTSLLLFCYCCRIIFLYAVNMCCSRCFNTELNGKDRQEGVGGTCRQGESAGMKKAATRGRGEDDHAC